MNYGGHQDHYSQPQNVGMTISGGFGNDPQNIIASGDFSEFVRAQQRKNIVSNPLEIVTNRINISFNDNFIADPPVTIEQLKSAKYNGSTVDFLVLPDETERLNKIRLDLDSMISNMTNFGDKDNLSEEELRAFTGMTNLSVQEAIHSFRYLKGEVSN